MRKRLAVYKQNIDERGHDLGEEQCLLILDKTLTLAKGIMAKTIKKFDAQSVTVFRSDQATDKSVIGRAIAGGILMGGVGAIVGGLSGTTKTKTWLCEITEYSGQITLLRLRNESDAITLKKWCNKHM